MAEDEKKSQKRRMMMIRKGKSDSFKRNGKFHELFQFVTHVVNIFLICFIYES